MRRNERKRRIRQKIIAAAQVFRSTLCGITFLFCFEGRYIEILFRSSDFLHLTGVSTSLSASQFYRNAVKGMLTDTQFSFDARHPMELSDKKTDCLMRLADITRADTFVMEDFVTNTCVYRFGLTDLNFSVGVCEDIDGLGVKKSDLYFTRTLRVGDDFKKATDVYSTSIVFSKPNGSALYDSISFKDKLFEYNNLPDDIRRKLSPNLIVSLQEKVLVEQL